MDMPPPHTPGSVGAPSYKENTAAARRDALNPKPQTLNPKPLNPEIKALKSGLLRRKPGPPARSSRSYDVGSASRSPPQERENHRV